MAVEGAGIEELMVRGTIRAAAMVRVAAEGRVGEEAVAVEGEARAGVSLEAARTEVGVESPAVDLAQAEGRAAVAAEAETEAGVEVVREAAAEAGEVAVAVAEGGPVKVAASEEEEATEGAAVGEEARVVEAEEAARTEVGAV